MLMALADDILLQLIAVNEHNKIPRNDIKLVEKIRTFLDVQRIGRELSH